VQYKLLPKKRINIITSLTHLIIGEEIKWLT
jgi:hypothetical protein